MRPTAGPSSARSAAASANSDSEGEESFFDILKPPKPTRAAALLRLDQRQPASTRGSWWFGGGSSGAAKAIESKRGTFASRFDIALRAPPTNSAKAAVEAALEAEAAKSAGRSRRLKLLACRDVAMQVIGAAEALELQRLVREHCRRPCSVLRATMLQGATIRASERARSAGATVGTSGAASAAEDLAAVEAEAEAAALATLGASRSGPAPGLSADGSDDPIVAALLQRVNRAAEAALGPSVHREVRAALARRPAISERALDGASTLALRLALHDMRQRASALVLPAVQSARDRSRQAAALLLAPVPIRPATDAERERWGLKLLGPPPLPRAATIFVGT